MKEQIGYYENNFRIIATQASVLAGFSFSLLGTEIDVQRIGVGSHLIFVTFTALAIAFNIMAVAILALLVFVVFVFVSFSWAGIG